MHCTRVLVGLAAVALLSACAATDAKQDVPLQAQHVSWAMYQQSPGRNAVFANYTIPQDWSYDAKAKINSGLALVGNTLLFTTFAHKVVAVDVRSGKQLWSAQVPNIAMSTPVVAGGMVYIGTGKSGILPRRWNIPLKLRFGNRAVWGVPGGDEFAAFDLRTGKQRWAYRTVGEDMPSPVYDRGRLIFANGDWHAYALNAQTGRELWSTDLGGVSTMASALMADGNVIVAVCTDGMRNSSSIALNPVDGKIVWRSPYGHCDASPAYGNGKVFVSSVTPGESRLQGKTLAAALDAKTGKALWVYHGKQEGLWSIIGSDEAAVAGAYADGTYYQAAPFDDELIAFDGNTGKVRWRFHTSGPAKMSPVVQNGRLYIGDTAGLLYTLNARDGSLIELREFKQPFTTSPPIIAGNKMLVVNGTSVDAIPITGRPKIGEPVGWGIVSKHPQMNDNE